MKQCVKCSYAGDNFYSGRSVCKECYNTQSKTQHKTAYPKQRDRILAQKAQYHLEHGEKRRAYAKARHILNKDNLEIKEKKRVSNRNYRRKRYNSDPLYKLSQNLRIRLNKALIGNQKTGSAVQDLGCSIEELKRYLESKFEPGMNWENQGYYGWHIDHIRPLSSFDLSDHKQLKQACHYTNLQPLWAKDHLLKTIDDIRRLER